ncbi:MAG TPA: twin-arginine translocase subunit TatC [Prolixibacteraceae bacterium]|jgi:sec-independent protein translocase protein TatC
MSEESISEEQSTKKKKKEPKAEMSFLDHLETLRWVIIKAISAIIVCGIMAYIYSPFVWSIIFAPRYNEFWTSQMIIKLNNYFGLQSQGLNKVPLNLINFEMSGQFMVDVWTAIIVGFIVAFPFVVYQFWSFVKPALYENEKRHASGAVVIMSALFLIGILFGYYLIVPFSIDWLASYAIGNGAVVNQINILSYISTVTSIVISGGIAFELPVVIYFLSKIGLLTPKFLRKYRRHAYVLLLIIAAIITPPDVLSQMIVSIPLILLYEVSIFISARVDKAHQKKMAES